MSDLKDALPEDMREDPLFSNMESVEDLAKEHRNVQKLVGADKVVLPKEDTPLPEVKSFFEKLGRPEDITAYDISDIERPENMPWDGDLERVMKTAAHQAGMNPAQVKKLFEPYIKHTAEQWSNMKRLEDHNAQQASEALRSEWGTAYDENVTRATNAFHQVFGSDGEEMRSLRLANGDHLGNHPKILTAMAKLADLLGEHGALEEGDSEGGHRFGVTRDEALAQLNELSASEEFQKDLYDRSRPGHKAAVEKRRILYEQAYPEPRAS
jgi:hypothetical protein